MLVVQHLLTVAGDAPEEQHLRGTFDDQLAIATQHHLVAEGHPAAGLNDHIPLDIDALTKDHVLRIADVQALQVGQVVDAQLKARSLAVEVTQAGTVGTEDFAGTVPPPCRDHLHVGDHANTDGDARSSATARAAGQAHVVVNAIPIALPTRADAHFAYAIADAAVDGDRATGGREVQHVGITQATVDAAGDGQ